MPAKQFSWNLKQSYFAPAILGFEITVLVIPSFQAVCTSSQFFHMQLHSLGIL